MATATMTGRYRTAPAMRAEVEAFDIISRLSGTRKKIVLEWLRAFEKDDDVETLYDAIMHQKAMREYERGETVSAEEVARRLGLKMERKKQ